ncbi:SMI1/KNR4 family protein [Rugamonas rivuli]|uniref:SMI1/KNR4 family protein n=1 Tax=Rugamonas rivuli TaxID=2743358 RepID=UPI00158438DD|nr:SMI1/KNR4 family protein [Rugamonas rivuli]
MSIAHDWHVFEQALQRKDPNLLQGLNAPATDEQVRQLEKHLGTPLPTQLKECLRIHDGQDPEAPWLFAGCEFMSTRRIARTWSLWQQLAANGDFRDLHAKPDHGVRALWWSPHWIPLTFNGSGDHDCLDMSPAAGGKSGQIIRVWHDHGQRALVADSFAAWFADLPNHLT